MISKAVIERDDFIDLSKEARLLYFFLCINADDEGFIGNARGLMRMQGIEEKALDELKASRYAIKFKNGVIVVTHWHIHNSIRKDRRKTTEHLDEQARLNITDGGEYEIKQEERGTVET